MSDKNFWIRKYNDIKGLGDPYLIADFHIQKGKLHPIGIHELFIDEDDFNYNLMLLKGGEIGIKNRSDNIEMFVNKCFSKSLRNILSNVESSEKINLKVKSKGEKVLQELQNTKIFNDLKKEILKAETSDSFQEFLEGLDQAP